MALSKQQIVGASDIKTTLVPVPEWGGDVAVRVLTAAERDAFEQSLTVTKADGRRELSLGNMTARLCAACIVDEVTGDRLFTDAEIGELANKSGTALKRVFDVAQRINGMGAGAVEDAEKNSAAAPGGSSSSA